MPLGMEVGLGPGHIVLDGDPAPSKGHSPNFRLMSVLAKRQDGSSKMPLGTEVGLGHSTLCTTNPIIFIAIYYQLSELCHLHYCHHQIFMP